MNFIEAVATCFRKYATFRGRALRSEYWYFYLFTIVAGNAIALLPLLTESEAVYEFAGLAYVVFTLGIIVPTLSVTARRLHDSGCSGWALLWCLTIIGIPFVLYWLIRKGDPGANAYGDPFFPPDEEPASAVPHTASSDSGTSATLGTSQSSGTSAQLESRGGVNIAGDLRDTTKGS